MLKFIPGQQGGRQAIGQDRKWDSDRQGWNRKEWNRETGPEGLNK